MQQTPFENDESDPARAARINVALANRILVHQGVLDAFGHVSTRDPTDPARFLLSRNMAPALVGPEDVLSFDLDGDVSGDGNTRVYLERFIHAAIYKARPDVLGVVHSHAASVVPFTVVRNATLRPVCHMSGFLTSHTPLFEIRDYAGPGSDHLIRSNVLGDQLAVCLGKSAVVLMRGHGLTVVGTTLEQAVFRAVYAEKNAKIQAAALALGEVTFLNDAEAMASDVANSGQVSRAWDYWSLEAREDVSGT